MEPGNPNDPLLLQVLPRSFELIQMPGFSNDPLGEAQKLKIPGLLHKYKSRVLLLLAGGCAVNCRYCFRRHFPYQENVVSIKHIERILEYIEQDNSIQEIILSGGDPLVVKDELLQSLITRLDKIKHLKYLRLHTRFPIMIPERITDDLIKILKNTHLICSVVVHCNHPNEINQHVADAIEKLRVHKINVFNQSVLLKNINDSAEILIELSHRLYAAGIMPYYLNLLDPVQGAAHFDVKEDQAKQIMHVLRRELPGYLVPKLVREIEGEFNKVPIS
jgi:EF-P beta-lysylation protein EpmB